MTDFYLGLLALDSSIRVRLIKSPYATLCLQFHKPGYAQLCANEAKMEILFQAVMKEFRGICGVCFLKPAVTCHHIRPRSTHPQLAEKDSNLIPVCDDCHDVLERGVGGMTPNALERRREWALALLS